MRVVSDRDPDAPNLLIIGAMKGGSSSLAAALIRDLGAAVPYDKEVHLLSHYCVNSEDCRKRYRKFFAREPQLYDQSTRSQLLLDASTSYSKWPDVPGIPNRALEVCGPDLKILYIIRDRWERLNSHYRHECSAGKNVKLPTATNIDVPLVNYSLYSKQIQPWLSAFDAKNIRILRLEDLSNSYPNVLCDLAQFLACKNTSKFQEFPRENSTESLALPGPSIRKLVLHGAYRNFFRPLLSPQTRAKLRKILFRAPSVEPIQLDSDTISAVSSVFERDSIEFERLVNLHGLSL